MKIVHISDIHWRGLSRHAEFTRAFERLFEKVKVIKPDLIFLGGDYFHTKTSGISPEVIDRLAWMFKNLGDLAPTHMILGNHDGNLANESREDAISPIIKAMNHRQVRLYKKSARARVFTILTDKEADEEYNQDVGFNLDGARGAAVYLNSFSCFDKEGWATLQPKRTRSAAVVLQDHGNGRQTMGMGAVPCDRAINIAAFHGSVGGTQMDNGWVMPDSKAEVMLSMFDGYDFVLLGDIHKRQFLAQRPDKNGVLKPYVAYPGSTIQQNFGEDETKGFLVWDIRAKDDWDVEFVEVENFQPYITFPWKDTVEGTLEALEGSRKLVHGARYRVTSKTPLSPLLERQLSHELKVGRGAEEVVFKSENSLNYDTILHNGVSVKKTSLRNDKNVIHGFYQQFLNANTKKFVLSKEQIQEGMMVIDGYLDKFNAQELETARDVTWSLKSFEFDNLYRYGEGNKIDFDSMNGVVGVFGKNKMGKSSLIGALMYALFNGSDRDGVTKNGQVMNQNKKTCSAKVVITVNGKDYRIERSSSRAEAPKRGKKAQEEFDVEKTETKLTFVRLNPDGSEETLNGTSRDETDKAIRKLLGNSQDFLMTSVATQRRMESFIDEGPTARKTILNRFLDLDIFEKLYGFAKEDIGTLNAKTSTYSMGWEQATQTHESTIHAFEKEIKELEGNVLETRGKLDELRLWIAQNESADATDATVNLVKVQQELFSLTRQLSKTELDHAQLNADLQDIATETEKLQAEGLQTDVAALQASLKEMQELQDRLRTMRGDLREVEVAWEAQKKSVHKLTLVPCGDQFPTCLYIKDSHQDKLKIDAHRGAMVLLQSQLEMMTKTFQGYQEQQYAEKMARYAKVQQSIKELTKEHTEKMARLSLLEKSKKDLALRLQQTRVREEELQGKAALQDTEALAGKKEQLESLQLIAYGYEVRKNDLLIRVGQKKAALDQIQKDKAECEVLLGKLRVLESVQAAFHKNGIPAMVLKTQLPAINAELAKLLGGLVDFTITFETEAGSNVMDVYIEDGHSRRILELGSGMEKMLASIAIRVALVNLSSLPKSDLLVIDEGFNALDEEHVGKCLELLQALKGYFKSILVISHMQRVKEAADTIIEVVTVGTDSRIEA